MHLGKIKLSVKIAFFYSSITFAIVFSSLFLTKTLVVRYSLINYSATISEKFLNSLNTMVMNGSGKGKMSSLLKEFTIIYGKDILSDPYEIKENLVVPRKFPSIEEVNGTPYVFVNVGKIDGKNIVVVASAYQLKVLEDTLNFFTVLLSLLSAIVVVGIGIIFSTEMLKPLKKLSKELEDVKSVSIDKKLSDQDNEEFQQLVDALNSMLERLKKGFERQEQFVSDASHELRTPLAALLANLDMISRWGKNDEEVLNKSISEMKISVKRLKSLVDSLLALSRGQADVERERFDIRKLAEEVVKEVCTIHPDFKIKIIGNGEMKSDREKIKEILRIFLDNAIKYSKESRNIVISVSDGEVSVEDFGIGIPEEDVEHIFDRFYRTEKSRSGESFGLGLSIAKKIADLLGAKIEVRSAVGKGSKFTILDK